MQIYLLGGPSQGERFDAEEAFAEGDRVTWTPVGEVARTPGPFEGGAHIINETDAEVDGVQHRTAVWRD